jgi:hypothetical protein
MVASNFRAVEKSTLRGFFTVTLASGLVLHECALHEKGLERWVSLPTKPILDADGRQRRDTTGKPRYAKVVEIPHKFRRDRFQGEALAALDRLLAKGGR